MPCAQVKFRHFGLVSRVHAMQRLPANDVKQKNFSIQLYRPTSTAHRLATCPAFLQSYMSSEITRLGRMPSPNVGGGYPSGCSAFENRLWGIGKRRILTMTQLMTHSDTTQSLGFLSIDRLDWVTVATRKPDVDTLEANPGPECRYGEKRASPSTKIMQASKEMPQKIFCTTAKYSLCI